MLSETVFLTGATGFVGAHLLAELLVDPARHVLALTRQPGLAAIETALRRYDLWNPQWAGRITALQGDLGQPDLGLSRADLARVTGSAGAVIHCGAEVHHLRPYGALRAANVVGCETLLRLCAEAGMALHHVSTLSALRPGRGQIPETLRAAELDPPQGGYNQSKWVAEQLVAEAAERGLPCRIYRLGTVAGHSRTGHCNPADILTRQLRGYLVSGVAPEGRALLNLLPVDDLARAFVHLAAQPWARCRWRI